MSEPRHLLVQTSTSAKVACGGTYLFFTRDSEKVTCPGCIEVMARQVDHLMNPQFVHAVGQGVWDPIAHSGTFSKHTLCGLLLDDERVKRTTSAALITCPDCKVKAG